MFLRYHTVITQNGELSDCNMATFSSMVLGGTRYALTMGFTCDKSKAIPDPGLWSVLDYETTDSFNGI